MKFSLSLLLMFVLVAPSAVAATIHVPADQPTIQAGIDAAVNGDTVLVADGTYTGSGNRDIDFHGKAVKVCSESGREFCTIDCQSSWAGGGGGDFHRAFILTSGEGPESVIQGFTIRNGAPGPYMEGPGGAIYCSGASPRILDNAFFGNGADGYGGAICCSDSTEVMGNYFSGNWAHYSGGGLCIESGSPLVANNIFEGNEAHYGAGAIGCSGGSPLLINNLIVGNYQHYDFTEDCGGGGIACHNGGSPEIINCTIVDNHTGRSGGGIFIDSYSSATVTNSILWGNNIIYGSYDQINGLYGGTVLVEYSDVMDGWTGTGNLDLDPLFIEGPDGQHYLSQVAAGQTGNSPCLNTGSDLAANICVPVSSGSICMDDLTTRTDQATDTGQVDMGFHFDLRSLSSSLTGTPDSGTLPLTTQLSVSMRNYIDFHRTFAGRIDLTLASGVHFSNWRAGYTNLEPHENYVLNWSQQFPALGSCLGDNVLELKVRDVTAPPYNQPPFPPAGEADRSIFTVTGLAP